MTLIDVAFRYRVPPGEREMSALACVHEVYGVRKISFDEAERVIKVEFDISRLTEDDIAALLRGAGVDIQERISLIVRGRTETRFRHKHSRQDDFVEKIGALFGTA